MNDNRTSPRLEVAVAALSRAACEAAGRTGLYEERVVVAGLPVRIRFAGARLRDQMMPPFEHIRSDEEQTPELEVAIWDSAESGVALPSEIGRPFDHKRKGYAQLQSDGRILSLFEEWDRGLSVLDLEADAGFYWTPDSGDTYQADRASPLQTILNWWLPTKGRTAVHAAALGTEAGAVLLFGNSGAGKSTTSLACVEAGFRYLGDDFCALTMNGDEVTAHCLYTSGKVFEHNLARLPGFAPLVTNPGRLEAEKAIGYLTRRGPDVVVRSMPVRAIAFLARKGLPSPSITRIPASKALLSLGPSTVLNLPGSGKSQLAGLAALAARVPCYEMHLAQDLEANPPALRALLGSIS